MRTARVRLQNEADRAERLMVTGSLRSPVLAPGRSLDLTVRVTRRGAARPGDARTVRVLAVSAHERSRRDSVATTVRATR